MTELFIDGTAVVLPADLSVAVKRENALFTKNGEYTYDITLGLDNPVNAELYRHLNRLTRNGELPEKRSAVLIADNRVYCRGTEIITGWTEKTVSLQVASGASELNYFIGSDELISTLQLQTTYYPYAAEPFVEKLYPEVDFCQAPVINRAGGYTVNEWAGYLNNRVLTIGAASKNPEHWYPQPYLCAYLREVIQALGYTLQLNQLEQTVYKDLYICHVLETYNWNEMLPGWTVKDFLTQVELLFNAVFVIDHKQKTARLLFRNSFYQGSDSVHLTGVEDAYEAEIEDDDATTDYTDGNIRYSFPDNAYFRWKCVPDEIMKKAKRDTIPAGFESFFVNANRLEAWFAAHQNKDVIYTDEQDGREYLYLSGGYDGGVKFAEVNAFKALARDDEKEADYTELDILPVEMERTSVWVHEDNPPVGLSGDIELQHVPLPVIEGSDTGEQEEDSTLLEDMLNEGVSSASKEGKGKIFLSFYTGTTSPITLRRPDGTTYRNFYPNSFTTEYFDETAGSFTLTNNVGASLRLTELERLFYRGVYDIDVKRAIKISCHDPNLYDAFRVFEIRNRRYVCREMEFTLDAYGRKGAWKGTFYPITISDTEADARWILADGKWRDGGVWLDNGRWID